jgi:hypothetical protein
MADLSWTAETGYDCSETGWIKINGRQSATGTGSATPSVKISPASSANDCTSGYILFTTSNGDSKKIPITRCLPDCSCSSIGYNDRMNGNTYETASTTVTAGTYIVNECSDGVNFVYGGSIIESMAKNNETITAVIKENSGNARSDFYKITYNGSPCFEGRITQKGKVSDCYTEETCAYSITTNVPNKVPCPGDRYNYTINNGDNNCWSLEDIYYSCGGWFTVEPGDDWKSGKIVVYKNDKGEERSSTCTFVLQNASNGKEANLSFDVTQEACCVCSNITIITTGDTGCSICNCNCDNLKLTPAVASGSLNISEDGLDETKFATYEKCISDDSIDVVLSDSWMHKRVENGDIYVSIDANETTRPRQCQVTINYSVTCDDTSRCPSKTINILEQGIQNCYCENITNFPTDDDLYNVTIGTSVGDSVDITYGENCVMTIQNDASNFVDVVKNENSIKITANSALATGSRTGNVKILSSQGRVCKTISVTQGTSSCEAGTYYYKLNVSQPSAPGVFTGDFNVYLCTQPIQSAMKAQGLKRNGTALGSGPGNVNVCQFEVNSSGSFVRLVGGSGIINNVLDDGSVTTNNFATNRAYYICCVQNSDSSRFYQYGTQADLKTNSDVTCADYTQEVNN